MELGELAVLIPSETVRNYAVKTGWAITDWDAASILYHRDRPESDVRQALYALRDRTEDAVLKEQLTEYLDREDRAFQLFQSNDSRACIYTVVDADTTEWHFNDYATAFRFAAGLKTSFAIRKHEILTAETVDQHADDLDPGLVGTLHCDEKGNIVSFDSEEIPTALSHTDSDWHNRFEHRFYAVPNPFDRGSIVQDITSRKLGIVETSQEEWFEGEKRVRATVSIGADYTDVQVRVVFPNEDGYFVHEHINPINLERYELGNSADSSLEMLLLAASDLYRERDPSKTSATIRRSIGSRDGLAGTAVERLFRLGMCRVRQKEGEDEREQEKERSDVQHRRHILRRYAGCGT